MNTEYEKVRIAQRCDERSPQATCTLNDDDNEPNQATDDLTEDMITYLKTVGKKSSAVELANACGLRTSGKSMTSIVSMLENHIREGNDCTTLFEKFARKSGSLMMGMCTHGIVHCVKFMLTYESPRDIVDLLKSLKYMPNVTICDIPQQLVSHGNKRGQLTFPDNDGMLCSNTDGNLQAARDGELTVELGFELGFVEHGAYARFPEASHQLSRVSHDHVYDNTNEHPLTGERKCFVLFDRLHEKNRCNKASKLLSSVKLVP